MSATALSARLWPAGGFPRVVVRAAASLALGVVVCCSLWIAVGAADGLHWLELPGGANPAWVDGPLRGLASAVGSLDGSALSAALIGLSASYLVALACAGSVSLRAALIAVGLANLAFTLGPTLVSTDVFGYIAYARELVRHGINPYVLPPASAPHDAVLPLVYWRGATTPYGPLFTFGSAPLGLLSVTVALWVYKAVAGAASVAIAALVAAGARRRGVNPARAAIFVGLNPVVLFWAVSGGHNDLLAVLLVVGSMALVLRGRSFSPGGVAVAAAAVKLTLGIALPFVLLGAQVRGRASRGALLALAAVAFPALIAFGPHVFAQLHRITTDPQFDIRFSGPDRLGVLVGTGLSSGVRTAALAFTFLSALLAVAWVWRGGDWITGAGWATLGLIGSIASLSPWYLMWLLPFAVLGRSRALRVAALLLTAYLLAIHLPALGQEPWLSGPHV